MEQNCGLIVCPHCHGQNFNIDEGTVACNLCGPKYSFKKIGSIYSFLDTEERDVELSVNKWNLYYNRHENELLDTGLENYLNEDYPFVYSQLVKEVEFTPEKILLEIGCGPMFLGCLVAEKLKLVVGVDFSLRSLLLAEALLKKRKISNYLLVHADIKKLPLKDSSVDIIYGGGVLEHFKNTPEAVFQMYRVLNKGGAAFNTVPLLNLSALTYRQIWGNIPNAPILKQLAEFVHIKILKSRFMKFGYELSFTQSYLRKIHLRTGFRTVKVEYFDTRLIFKNFRGIIKKLMLWAARNIPFFKPMGKVIAFK